MVRRSALLAACIATVAGACGGDDPSSSSDAPSAVSAAVTDPPASAPEVRASASSNPASVMTMLSFSETACAAIDPNLVAEQFEAAYGASVPVGPPSVVRLNEASDEYLCEVEMGDDNSSVSVQRGACGLLDDLSIIYSPVGPTYPYPSIEAFFAFLETNHAGYETRTLSTTQMMAAGTLAVAVNSDGYMLIDATGSGAAATICDPDVTFLTAVAEQVLAALQ
jgi:hypothetical protein